MRELFERVGMHCFVVFGFGGFVLDVGDLVVVVDVVECVL